MPCVYNTPEDDIQEANRELDRITRLLCEAVGFINMDKYAVSKELREWTKAHNIADEKRRREEKQKKCKHRWAAVHEDMHMDGAQRFCTKCDLEQEASFR